MNRNLKPHKLIGSLAEDSNHRDLIREWILLNKGASEATSLPRPIEWKMRLTHTWTLVKALSKIAILRTLCSITFKSTDPRSSAMEAELSSIEQIKSGRNIAR